MEACALLMNTMRFKILTANLLRCGIIVEYDWDNT